MDIKLKSEVVEKLSARGVLAYVAVAIAGPLTPVAELAKIVHVGEELMQDGLRSLAAAQVKVPKQSAKRQPATSGFVLPGWVDVEAWQGFEEMRRASGFPMTDRARELIVKDLIKLASQGQDHVAVLNQSSKLNWRGVFAVKPDFSEKPKLKATEFAR